MALSLLAAVPACGHATTPATTTPATATPPAPQSCSTQTAFAAFAPTIHGTQTATMPATTRLASGGNGQMLFHQPPGAGQNQAIFRVFEFRYWNTLNAALLGQAPLPPLNTRNVLSVLPAPQDPVSGQNIYAGYGPGDSTLLQFTVDPPPGTLFQQRYFVVVECLNGQPAAWGDSVVTVSNSGLARGICFLVVLLTYAFAMLVIWRFRRSPNALLTKYPAIFGARALHKYSWMNPIYLIENQFHEASVQKLQVLLFSFLVGTQVLFLVITTGTLVNISPTVVALLGISGVGAAASQVAYQQKLRLSYENYCWLLQRHVITPTRPQGPFWRDLVLSNGEFDIYKLQTIIFSLSVASALTFADATTLSSFTVPDNLLGILGLSQVIYVGGVLVKPPAVADLDDALTKLRQAGETVAAAKVQHTDTDVSGKLVLPPVKGNAIAENAQRQYDDQAKNIVTMIETALGVEAHLERL